MNKESPFLYEYQISDSTELPDQEKSSTSKANLPDEIRKKFESKYELAKPRREIISARIIEK